MLVDFLVNDAYNYCVSLSEDELPALPPLTGNAFRKNPCDSPWAVMRFVRTHNGLCLPQIVNTVPLVVERRLCGYHRKPSSNPLSLHTKPSSLREGTASAVEGVFSPAMTTDFAVIANQCAHWCGNLREIPDKLFDDRRYCVHTERFVTLPAVPDDPANRPRRRIAPQNAISCAAWHTKIRKPPLLSRQILPPSVREVAAKLTEGVNSPCPSGIPLSEGDMETGNDKRESGKSKF